MATMSAQGQTLGAASATALGGATYGGLGAATYGGSTGGIGKSASLPTLLPSAATAPSGLHPRNVAYVPCRSTTVSWSSLRNFLFPQTLENPNSCGRLELFARFGPADEEGQLRGGPGGSHVHTNFEIDEMVRHECREALFRQISKPRSDCEAIVDSLLPFAMACRYTEGEVQKLLRKVPQDDVGRMDFFALQRTVLESQRKRLQVILKRVEGGKPIAPPKERPQKVGFQSGAAAALMAITKKKKYGSNMEEEIATRKRLHSYSSLVASVEQQNLGAQVRGTVLLVRHPGDVNDRWDRYCALRRTGRSGYVNSRNEGRFNPSLDDGLGNKYPGTSSLLAANAGGSSAAAQLAA